jgi:hypothetical protein
MNKKAKSVLFLGAVLIFLSLIVISFVLAVATPFEVVIGEGNVKINEINGTNMTVVGGSTIDIGGTVNASAGNLANWSINVYNKTGGFVNAACFDASGNNINQDYLCTWDTNVSCPDSECWNYSLQLIAYDTAGNSNESNISNILIDNVPPFINPNATLTLETSNMGGLYSMKQWNARVNILDTYLRDVRVYVLDNGNNTVIEWGQHCNENDSDNCNQSRSGMFNKTWHAEKYSINGENVSAHYVFNFNLNNKTSYVSVPGCFDENETGSNYSCYETCEGMMPSCREWRWHLVYNVSNFTGSIWTGRLLGLVRDDWCNESGCNISTSLIHSGASKFVPQKDSFNFETGNWSQNNLTPRTLYNPGDLRNVNLTQDMPSGNYQFAFSANDYWWGSMRSWNIYVDNELPVVNNVIINNPDNFFSFSDNVINISANVTDDQNVSLVQADLHGINNGSCEPSNCYSNLSYNNLTGLWDGLIDVSSYITAGQVQGTGLWIIAYDTSNNRNEYTNQSVADIVIDTVGPEVTVISPSSAYTNSVSIMFNINSTDVANSAACWMTLNNGSNNATMTKLGDNFNCTSSIAEGNYLARYYCNDTLGNLNNSVTTNFTVDRQAPAVPNVISSVSSSGATISYTSNESVNINVTYGTSASLGSSATSSSYAPSGSVDISGLSASTLYYYNATVCDQAGNCATNGTYNFTTSVASTGGTTTGGAGGGGGAAGGGEFWIATFFANDASFKDGYTKELAEKWRFEFKLNNTLHTVGIFKLTNKTATINVSSIPQQKTLSIGDEWKVDVNADNYYDVYIKLNGIANSKANVTIKGMQAVPVSAAPEAQPTPGAPEAVSKANMTKYIIIAVIAVLIIAIVVVLIIRKKSQERHHYSR